MWRAYTNVNMDVDQSLVTPRTLSSSRHPNQADILELPPAHFPPPFIFIAR
jgi:hypothetical protein